MQLRPHQGQALWEWFSMAGTRRLAVGPRPFYHPVPTQLPARPEKPNFTWFQWKTRFLNLEKKQGWKTLTLQVHFKSHCNLHTWGVKWHIIFTERWVGNDIHLGAYFATNIERKQQRKQVNYMIGYVVNELLFVPLPVIGEVLKLRLLWEKQFSLGDGLKIWSSFPMWPWMVNESGQSS